MEKDEHALKAGLEIHQQLGTGKLFCGCPSELKEGKADYEIKRKMMITASETGEFDAAALEMAAKNYSFVYRGYNDACCLVENDEEPPRECNKEALDTALEVSLMLGSDIPDKLCVMRKNVIDGSNVSGFQRTILVSLGGKIKTAGGKEIGIQALALEEDAARPISRNEEKKEIVYSLDRLGIPLIEIATEPCLKTPEEVKEAALAIGEALRLTGKAKRGLGTIRQDLNISIAGGARVEIKGVQELDKIDEYVKREVDRQKALLGIKMEIVNRGISKDEMNAKELDVGNVFRESACGFLKKTVAAGQVVHAKKIHGFRGILGTEVQPGRRFGTELASCVKSKTGLKGLLHSDENLSSYGISEKEIREIRLLLGCKENDAFAMVSGKKEDCARAMEAITERCKIAFDRIPEETRNALEDGNTEYSRPLPGAARMYPETDIPKIEISKNTLKEIRGRLPKSAAERLERYTKKYGMSTNLAEKMKLSNHAKFFEMLAEEGHDATTLAAFILEWLTEMKREGIDVSKASEGFIEEAMKLYKEGKIGKNMLKGLVKEALSSGKTPNETLAGFQIEKIGNFEVEKRIEELIEANREKIKEKGQLMFSALMGDLMKEYRGKIDAKTLGDLLRKKLEETVKARG